MGLAPNLRETVFVPLVKSCICGQRLGPQSKESKMSQDLALSQSLPGRACSAHCQVKHLLQRRQKNQASWLAGAQPASSAPSPCWVFFLNPYIRTLILSSSSLNRFEIKIRVLFFFFSLHNESPKTPLGTSIHFLQETSQHQATSSFSEPPLILNWFLNACNCTLLLTMWVLFYEPVRQDRHRL